MLFCYFLICSKIYAFIFQKISDTLISYIDNITEGFVLFYGIFIFIIFYCLIGEAFVLAFLYQFFRKKSYKEKLEKAKKLLEENLISQEEFETINKNISTAK